MHAIFTGCVDGDQSQGQPDGPCMSSTCTCMLVQRQPHLSSFHQSMCTSQTLETESIHQPRECAVDPSSSCSAWTILGLGPPDGLTPVYKQCHPERVKDDLNGKGLRTVLMESKPPLMHG